MNIINEALYFLLPRKCEVCGGFLGNVKTTVFNMDSPICFNCLKQIVPNSPDRRWFLCLSEPFSGDRYPSLTLYMPFIYYGFFSRAIPLVKFEKKQELAVFLGGFLAASMASDSISGDIIIPVPLSMQRLKERGFNQAELLAQKASETLNIPLVTDCLLRSRNTMRQTHIKDKANRSINVDGAFEVSENWSVDGLRIILVDDVATTGNTLHEAASALLDSGAKQVLCVALAGNRAWKNAESY